MPCRGHARGDQARSPRALAARRRDIADELTSRQVKLNSVAPCAIRPTRRAAAVQRARYDRRVRVDLIRMRTREGTAVARAEGRLRGKQPELSPRQEADLVELHRAGEHSPPSSPSCSASGRSTVYRTIERARHTDTNTELPQSRQRSTPFLTDAYFAAGVSNPSSGPLWRHVTGRILTGDPCRSRPSVRHAGVM